jgi:hypothetical protein
MRHVGTLRNQSSPPDWEDLRDARVFWFCEVFFVLRRLDSFRLFDCFFSVFWNLQKFDFGISGFFADRLSRLPRHRDGLTSQKNVCVISAGRCAAWLRSAAHTCLLRPKLHAVDVLSF